MIGLVICTTLAVYSTSLRLIPDKADKVNLVKTDAQKQFHASMDINDFTAQIHQWKDQDHNSLMIAEGNTGFHMMMKNWLAHLHKNGIKNYLVVALDADEYAVLKDEGEPVVSSEVTFTSQDQKFGTPDYNEMVKNKWAIVDTVLNAGVNVLLSDIDVVWFQNPFAYMASTGQSCSILPSSSDQNLEQIVKLKDPLAMNTGIVYFRATDETKRIVSAFREWHPTEMKNQENLDFYWRNDQALFFSFLNSKLHKAKYAKSEDQCNVNHGNGMTLSWKTLPRNQFPDFAMWRTHGNATFAESTFALHYCDITGRINGLDEKRDTMQKLGHWITN